MIDRPVCPYCGGKVTSCRVLWQGIHVCVEEDCAVCRQHLVSDLAVGQAVYTNFRVALPNGKLFGGPEGLWFGQPLQRSLLHPQCERKVSLDVMKYRSVNEVVILNCVDFIYGHSLLKLLNAERHINDQPRLGLVVIVPRALLWMVPSGVAEVWVSDIPFASAQEYFPAFHEQVARECDRFDVVYVSRAYSHPSMFNIGNFTGITPHNFACPDYRITFIWREDRILLPSFFLWRVLNRLCLSGYFLIWQKLIVRTLFARLRRVFPQARFTVAGLGTRTRFPKWVDDARVSAFTENNERLLCNVYAESRLVIGLHGSHMLLPSAHAGMTLDLMPPDRWGNLAQDILYQGESIAQDVRMISVRYHFLPWDISLRSVERVARVMIEGYETSRRYFTVGMKSAIISSYNAVIGSRTNGKEA